MNRYDPPSSPAMLAHPNARASAPGDDGPLALVRLIFSLVARNKKKLGAWIVAVTGLTAAYVYTLPFYYSASTTILLTPRQSTPENGAPAAAPAIIDMGTAESEMELIRSERVLATAFNAMIASPDAFGGQAALTDLLGGSIPPVSNTAAANQNAAWQRAFARFEDRVDLRRVGQSYAISLSYTANDPVLAARIANSITSAYLLQSLEAKAIQATADSGLLTRLESLQRQVDAARLATDKGMAPATATPSADAQIIGIARPPLYPSGPRKKLLIAFAAVVAFLTGTLALALSLGFVTRIRSTADLSRATRLPCLAVVPKPPRPGAAGISKSVGLSVIAPDTLTSPFALSIRNLRTAIAGALPTPKRGGAGRCIAFVAWDRQAADGAITKNLASVARRGGRHTILIETDFRSPTATRSDDGPQGAASLADILYNRIPAESVRFRDMDGVSFLPAASRDTAVNYFADLASPEMLRLMESASAKGDVYLDLPPLNEANDAAVMAQRVDAVVILVREGKTRSDELERATRLLADAGAHVIGVVLNEA